MLDESDDRMYSINEINQIKHRRKPKKYCENESDTNFRMMNETGLVQMHFKTIK